MNLSIGEIFEQGSKMEGDEQVRFFRKNWTPTLGIVIQYAVEPQYQFDLPEGRPPFKVNDLDDQESNLYAEVRRLYVFLKPSPQLAKHGGHIPAGKKEMLWIQLLENVSGKDSQVLLDIREGQIPFGITVERFKEIFPGLLSENAEVAEMVDPEPVIEAPELVKNDEPEQEVVELPAPKPARKRPAPKKKVVKKTVRKKVPAKKPVGDDGSQG